MNDRRLTEEAATWYLDMQESPDARTQAQFMGWLRRSPQHVAEYMAMAQMHGDMRAALAAEGMTVEELRALAASESSVVALRRDVDRGVRRGVRRGVGRGVGREHPSPMNRLLPQATADAPGRSRFIGDPRPRQPHMGAIKRLAAAAAVLLVCGGLMAAWPSPAAPGIRYAAGIDVREVTLDDDTVVQLSPESAMVVSFSADGRHIELLHGSASFDIGKDPARPMKVTVGRQQIDDIGTVFDVQRNDSAAQVTVVSGQVSVWNLPSPWIARIRTRLTGRSTPRDRIVDLHGGETARVDGDGHLAGRGPANVATATQWLPDDIRFHDATVAEVARRFNAYSTRPLIVDDSELGQKRISGVFHARDPEAFIAYIGSLPQVRVERHADGIRFVSVHGIRRL
jgi:transmembrane sensor